MLDKTSRKFLAKMNEKPNQKIPLTSQSGGFPVVPDKSDLIKLAEYLEKLGYTTVTRNNGGTPMEIELTHMGIHWKEFRKLVFLRYLEEKWIDCLAMLIALAALVIALCA